MHTYVSESKVTINHDLQITSTSFRINPLSASVVLKKIPKNQIHFTQNLEPD